MRGQQITADFKFSDYVPPEIRRKLRPNPELQEAINEMDKIIRLMEEVKQ